jgi:hypothetical protein
MAKILVVSIIFLALISFRLAGPAATAAANATARAVVATSTKGSEQPSERGRAGLRPSSGVAPNAPMFAPLVGTKNIPGDYADLATAISDLNAQGVGAGGVTFNLIAGNPQTAPVGGYVIGGVGSLVLTTASAANPIVFTGNANTITASPALTIGALNDGIFKLIGADWVTIQGFTMLENPLNNVATLISNTMTEWGVALLYVTTTDGAQNDTIQNNTIDLNRANANATGIYSNSTHTDAAVTTSVSAVGTAGGNSGLKIYGNNIIDVNNGIIVVGPTSAADQNDGIDIGGTTPATGNSITDFGSNVTFSAYANVTTGAVNGVLVRNSKNFNISRNTLVSTVGGVTLAGTINGIQVPASSVAPTGTLTQTINNNNISVRGGNVANVLNGINIPSTSVNATTTISINNNDFNTFGHTVAGGTGAITFIAQLGIPFSTSINNNTFTNMSVNTTGTVTFFSFAQSLPSGASLSISGNSVVTGFTRTGVGATTVWASNTSSVNGSSHAINNNNFSNITLTGASAFTGISDTEGANSTSGPVKSINGNTFNNITTGAGTVAPMSVNFSGANSNVNNNIITGIATGSSITAMFIGSSNQATLTVSGNTIDPITSGGTSVIGISNAALTSVISKNKIYDLSGTAAGSVVSGIVWNGSTASSTGTIVNNLVGNLTAPAATGSNAIVGINITGSATTSTLNVFYNTVYLNNTTSGAGFGSSALSTLAAATATTSALNLRNNILVNTSVQNGAGLTVAYRRSLGTAGALANYAITSNNNLFYAGTPGASNLIYSDGASAAQTIAAFRNGVFTAGTIGPRDSLDVSELPPFLSTTGSSPDFLHINPGTPTQAESGAAPIAGITDDFDGNTRNASTPDIGADEFAGILLDLTAPAITDTPLATGIVAPNRTVGNVVVTDLSGVNITLAFRPRLYYKKSTDGVNSINDNTSATAGWKFVQANGGGGSPFTFTIDYSLLFGGGGVSLGDTIQYFVVAQDLATTPNVGINSGIFNAPPSSAALTAAAFPITGTINSYNIAGGISGAKTVGAGGDYPTLTGAGGLFADINSRVLTGNLTVTITADLTEDGTNALNEFAESGVGGYTLTIQPDAGTIRNITGAVANGMIRFNGADRVTIDGRFGGAGQFLRFRNTNTSNPTFTFINDATNNTLESCLIESGNTSLTSGTVLFGTTTGTAGNSNNTIHNCDLRDRSDAAGVPANAVYSAGTLNFTNASNTVANCKIFNWTNDGILVTGTGAGNGWAVNQNDLYQTAAQTTAMIAISVQGGSGHSIVSNSIGGTATGAGGANLATSLTFRGIDLSVGNSPASSIQGNVVKNIRSTNPALDYASSYGIFIGSGTVNVGNVTGNSIGSSNVNERFEANGDCYAIRVISTTTANISNNTVNNFRTAATAPTGEFYFGMSIEGAGGTATVVNNTITNVTNISTPDASFSTQTIGLIVQATGASTIRGNTISNIGNTSTIAPTANNNRVWGLLVSQTAVGTVVDRNKVDNVFGSSTAVGARADVITSVQSQTVASATFTNNMISTTGGVSSDRVIYGFLDLSASPAVTNWYFNSVNITGTATAANNTYAFNRNNTSTTTLRNNILSNTRTGGTGFHVAIANTNASATGWSATASNNNLLNNVNPAHIAQWLGTAAGNNRTLATFRTDSGGDAATIAGDPLFISASDLHIAGTSPALMAGVTFGGVTTDFDSDPRPASLPDIGADELVQGSGGAVPAGTFYNASLGSGDTLTGDVTITNTLTLTGKVDTGGNTITINCGASIVGAGAGNYVIGNLKEMMCAPGTYAFPVGTANGYSPVTTNTTAVGGGGNDSLAIRAVQGYYGQNGEVPVLNANGLQRYWDLNETGSVTVDLTFNYLPGDVIGGGTGYRIIRINGTAAASFRNDPACPGTPGVSPCVNIATNSAFISGIGNFSKWTLGQQLAPTATGASIGGRILDAGSKPIANAMVMLTGGGLTEPVLVQTGPFGYYQFEGLPVGQIYVVTVRSGRHTFAEPTRAIDLSGNVTGADFVSEQ